jgi:peptidoglycan hydrolase-like protein with peptidoglycan-binding domain
MSASPQDHVPIDPWRASLRRSRARRRAAHRRARRRFRGRGTVLVLSAAMTLGAGGALAASPGSLQGAWLEKGTLSRGSTGAGVEALQRALSVKVDGRFGAATERAVRAFQREQGLADDGVVGPATRVALGLGPASAEDTADDSASSPRLEKIAQCESGGDPTAVSADGQYRGKYQFSRATWRSVGGSGDPAAAPESEQDRRAELLLKRAGPVSWPNCA